MAFDPNALVQAMGAQHDPYSWAKEYSKASDTRSNLLDTLQNHIEVAELNKEAQLERDRITSDRKSALAHNLSKIRLRDAMLLKKYGFDLGQESSSQRIFHDAESQGHPPLSEQQVRTMIQSGKAGINENSFQLIDPAKKMYIFKDPAKQPYKSRVALSDRVPVPPTDTAADAEVAAPRSAATEYDY